jgi:hypothetical protein
MKRIDMKLRRIMTRWFAILILLATCQGCMLFDEFDGFGPTTPPPGTCGMQAPMVQQTAEPPLR